MILGVRLVGLLTASIAVASSAHAAQIGPASPVLQSPIVEGTTVTIAWTQDASVFAPDVFALEVSIGTSQFTFVLPGDRRSMTVTDVPAGTYVVRLRANSWGLWSAASNQQTVTVGVGCPGPSQPVLTASISGAVVTLSWTALNAAGATFTLDVSGAYTGTFAVTGAGMSVNAFPGTFYVRLKAITACGESDWSASRVINVAGATPTLSPNLVALVPNRVWEFDDGTAMTVDGYGLHVRTDVNGQQKESWSVVPSERGLLLGHETHYVRPDRYTEEGTKGPGFVELIHGWNPPTPMFHWGQTLGESRATTVNKELNVREGSDGVVAGGCATTPWTLWLYVQQQRVVTVAAQERITVPAGTFDTLRVDVQITETNDPFRACGSEKVSNVTYWLAPNVGWVQIQRNGALPIRLLRVR